MRIEHIFKEQELEDRVLQAASSAQVFISRAFLETLARVQMRVDGEALVSLVEQGRMGEAVDLMVRALEEEQWGALWDATLAGLLSAASIAASLTQRRLTAAPARLATGSAVASPDDASGPEGRLVLTESGAASMVEDSRLLMLQELTAGARRALQTAALWLQQAQVGARSGAVVIRGALGLTEAQQRALQLYRQRLLEGSVRDMRRYVSEGRLPEASLRRVLLGRRLSETEVDRLVEKYRLQLLNARAVAVSRDRARWAVSFGQELFWQQQVRAGRLSPQDVRKEWLYTPDDRVRHAHRTIPMLNPEGRPLNVPFQSSLGNIMYPGDPSAPAANTANCRCTVLYRLARRSPT